MPIHKTNWRKRLAQALIGYLSYSLQKQYKGIREKKQGL